MPAPGLLCDVRVPPSRRGERLALTLTYGVACAAPRGAVVASPLPLLGGDMDNNVVRTLARTIARHGLPALRFDYRSVGDSHDLVPGEARFETWRRVEVTGDRSGIAADAEEALRRARGWFAPCLLAGYSFGSWTAVHLASRLAAPVPLVLVAPPLARVDLDAVAAHGARVLLVVAGADELSPPPTEDELRRRFPRARIATLVGADHFLRDREDDLEALVRTFLDDVLPVPQHEELSA